MKRSSTILAVAVAAVLAAPAQAQTGDLQSLVDALERLRGDVADLQRYVYAGEGEPPVSTADPDSRQSAAQSQAGLQALEERMRDLTGLVEELDHRQRRLADRVDGLIADLDARFAALEGGAPAAPPGDVVLPEAAAIPGLDGEDDGPDETGDAGGVLPPGSAMERYDFAFSLLSKADYEGAATAFEEFITLHPDSDLVGNAYYWLGSVNLVRELFRDAAVAFLKGYQERPAGPKAADNLLKLGVALSRLDKVEEACATFKELTSKFPDAAAALLDEASDEAAAAGCG